MNLLPSNKDVLQIFIFQFSLEHQLEHTDATNLQKKKIYIIYYKYVHLNCLVY